MLWLVFLLFSVCLAGPGGQGSWVPVPWDWDRELDVALQLQQSEAVHDLAVPDMPELQGLFDDPDGFPVGDCNTYM